MHFFVMGVRDASESDYPKDTSKAYASCWINDTNQADALEKAKDIIQSSGWDIIEFLEDYPISREDYSERTEGLQYFEQAITDGEVVVFFVPKQDC